MEQELKRQLKKIETQEQKILNHSDNTIMQNTLSPMMDKIQDKIPVNLKAALNTAFYKGFQLVFEKGNAYIEKTYNKEKIELEYDINNYAIDKRMNRKHISRLDRYSKQSKLINSSFSVLEGGVLGLFGIGLPDIPIFLSVLVKSTYEIALSYGYGYETPEEKSYILLLIRSAIAKGQRQGELNKELDLLSDKMDSNIEVRPDLERQMQAASDALSEAMLTAKFLQGIPVAGVIGGAVNYSIVNRVTKFAGLKYKKRYLQRKANAVKEE